MQLVHIEASVVQQLERSFDATGMLNTKTYPQLEDLRKEIERIGASVSKTMDELVQSSKFSNMLQVCFHVRTFGKYELVQDLEVLATCPRYALICIYVFMWK